MKVSIIIPVYNVEKYLEECIESALNQTYSDFEIIAVDDGSDDKSLEILKKYSNKIIVISKKNGGAASALNAGIKVARGEWLKWLNADDVLYPDALEQLLSVAENLSDKTNTILYANYDFIDSEGNVMGRKKEPNYNSLNSFDFNVILLDHHIGNQNTVLLSKTIVDKYGMFNETLGQEDYELHLRYCIVHNCRLHLVEKVVSKYRIHKNQISRANLKSPQSTEKVRDHVLCMLDPKERERYVASLIQYRNKRPISEKIKKLVGKMMFRYIPLSISSSIAKMYLRRTLGRNNMSKNDKI